MSVELGIRDKLIASVQIKHLLHRLELACVAALLQHVERRFDLLDEAILLLTGEEGGQFFYRRLAHIHV